MIRRSESVTRDPLRRVAQIVRLAATVGAATACSADAPVPRSTSPAEKLQVVAPLVGTRAAAASAALQLPQSTQQPRTSALQQASGRSRVDYARELERVAVETRIDPRRLELWLELLMSHGRPGLVALTHASATEMAAQLQGSWQMTARYIRGRASNVEARTYNEVVEASNGSSRLRSLTVEAGELDVEGTTTTAAANRFLLAAYGVMTHEDVRGSQLGLEEGETGVLQVFEGQFVAVNFPGIPPEGASVRLESLWVKQGDVYRTVLFQQTWRGAGDDGAHLMEPADIQITSWGDHYTLGYSNLDSFETHERMSADLDIGDLETLWRGIQQDPQLIDDAVRDPRSTVNSGDPAPVPPSPSR